MTPDQTAFWKFQARLFLRLILGLAVVLAACVVMTGVGNRQREGYMPRLQAKPVKDWIKMADGFDFPVGKPDAKSYYRSRGFRPNGHLGDDWNGVGGGNTDLGAPVYSIGHGTVVFSRDARAGWGNVVIIRHVYQSPDGGIRLIDSLYGHLDEVMVREKQSVRKGDQIGTIGTNRGMYWAHLHFEIRKNVEIGMRRSSFGRGFNDYHDPTLFIQRHRKLKVPKSKQMVALNTYNDDRKFFSPHSGQGKAASQRLTPLESDDDEGVAAAPTSSPNEKGSKRKGGSFFQRSDDYFY